MFEFLFKVIELADVEGFDTGMAYSFFLDVIMPNAVNKYQIEDVKQQSISFSSPDSGELLIVDLIVKCIKDYQLSVPKVYIDAIYNTQSIKYIRMVLIG